MTEPHGPESRYAVGAVRKALEVLSAFGQADELTLAEVAALTGQNKSSVFRLLCTLEDSGFIHRAGGGTYRLGVEVVHLAHRFLSRMDLRQVAATYMESLWQTFGDTVNLGALQGDEIVYVNIIESRYSFRMTATIGATVPIHAAAMGKAIAAHLPLKRVEEFVQRDGLPVYTPHTISTWDDLVAELDRVREQGYALDMEEVEVGARCAAVAVLGADGRVVGGLSLSAPASRMDDQAIKQVCQVLMRAGWEISRWLGYPGKYPQARAGKTETELGTR